MFLHFRSLSHIFRMLISYALLFCAVHGQIPTRPYNIWNPLESTTSQETSRAGNNDIMVKLSIGTVVGKNVLIPNLPWTANHDPLEQIPRDRDHSEPDPVSNFNDVSIFEFLGVPYAEPPVSQRRFKPPQQLVELPGDQPYLALNYAPSCAQDVEDSPGSYTVNDPYQFVVDEDCLYLNIFTPSVSSAALLIYPVIVFFHGGNFQTGSANEWPGHVLASRGIVVVTVNYRLGPFGFMSLGDSETGNYGFLDQRLALQFVQQHIAAFGGDPQAVTIVGHDAGAVSAGLHMFSPFSKNLFRAVAAMSGADVSYHSTIGKPALSFNNTMKLGRYLGCVRLTAEEVWNCIHTKSTSDILTATKTIPIEYNRYLFMPTVDGKQLPANPYWILNAVPLGEANIASPVPYLTGLNMQDGSEVILEDRTLGEFNDFLLIDQKYIEGFVLEYAFRHNYTMNREAIVEAIISRYTYYPDPSKAEKIRDKFIQLVTDAYYTAPISLSARLHSASGSRVFMYVNNYVIGQNGDRRSFPSWLKVCHDCDLYLLFGFPFMPKNLLPKRHVDVSWTASDRNASQLFMFIYRQFARNMNPDFPFSKVSWTPLEPRTHWYLDFNYSSWDDMSAAGKISRDYRWEDVAFWNHYIPSLVQYMTTTMSPSESRARRELVAVQTALGVVLCVLILITLLACVFAYISFERNPKRLMKMEREKMLENGFRYRANHRRMTNFSNL